MQAPNRILEWECLFQRPSFWNGSFQVVKGAERQVLLKNGLSFPKALDIFWEMEDISGGMVRERTPKFG